MKTLYCIGVLPEEGEAEELFYLVRAKSPEIAMLIAFAHDCGTFSDLEIAIADHGESILDDLPELELAKSYCRVMDEEEGLVLTKHWSAQ